MHGIAYSAQERDNYVNDAIGVADELMSGSNVNSLLLKVPANRRYCTCP